MHDVVDGQAHTFSYAVWCTGERELYDLVSDPYQVRNQLAPLNALGPFMPFDAAAPGPGGKGPAVSVETQRLLHRLDALTLVLKTCKGESCVHPYGAMFPGGKIVTLQQAMDRKYDDYFANLPKVRFDHCMLGYQSRLEKPEWEDAWAYGKKK